MEKRTIKVSPAVYLLFCLIGVLFWFFCRTAGDLAEQGNIIWTKAYTVKSVVISLAGGCLLGGVVCTLFAWWDSVRKPEDRTGRPGAAPGVRTWKVFAVSLLLTALAWLPAYLAYYPAICAYDTPTQVGQIVNRLYTDHHPLAHTLLLKLFMDFGSSVLGSVTAGIGIYAFLQMLFLAASLACGVALLHRRGLGWGPLILIQLLCMFYPFHWYMGITVTKDTVFTAIFVLLMLAFYELLRESDDKARRLRGGIGFLFAAAGMILFRNNGKYAFLILLILLVLVFLFSKRSRRCCRRLIFWSVGGLLLGSLLLSAVFRLSGAQQGDRREMLSVPIQQLARTMLYHGGVGVLPEDDNTMDEADKALIDAFISNEGYKKYRPSIADPVKLQTYTHVALYRAKEFVSTYLGLLLRYPGDYLNAALAMNAGYLYPNDESHAYINVTDRRVGRGYIQTCWEEEYLNEQGIYKESGWNRLYEKLERWADANAYLKIPVLKYLFVPGVWIWLYLVLLARLVMLKRYEQCIPLALVGGYFLTLLLGPGVQMRYIYPLMTAFPFILILSGDCGKSGFVQEGLLKDDV